MSTPRRTRLEAVTEQSSVTPLELFFDLVFVFALTQVTALMADDVTASGLIRGVLVHTAYTFLHLPLIVGVILVALGLKKVLGYVAGDDGHTLTDPIYGLPLAALYGGAALYLLGLVAFKYRTLGRLSFETHAFAERRDLARHADPHGHA